MSTKEFRCIGTLVLKSLLNTLGRAVEQLGECLANFSSRGQSATVVNDVKLSVLTLVPRSPAESFGTRLAYPIP